MSEIKLTLTESEREIMFQTVKHPIDMGKIYEAVEQILADRVKPVSEELTALKHRIDGITVETILDVIISHNDDLNLNRQYFYNTSVAIHDKIKGV